MRLERVMAVHAGIVAAAALHADGDDVERGMPVDAASLGIQAEAVNPGRLLMLRGRLRGRLRVEGRGLRFRHEDRVGQVSTMDEEETRRRALADAQQKAAALFTAIEQGGLIAAGRMESEINDAIYALAEQMFRITKYWHKRIVRAGRNTLAPYAENPPDLRVEADDILFLDLGPVFEEWEADFGRTYVLGEDPIKRRLARQVEEGFHRGRQHFERSPEITASQLFHFVRQLGAGWGWEFGGPIAGHLIGQFPHERIPQDKVSLYIHPQNHLPLRSPGADGRPRHWILEIHYVDPVRGIGGFFEELLTV
jgi:hypothetical protein